MKKWLVFVFSLILASGCSDGANIKGKVQDKISGKPISGVDVSAFAEIENQKDKKYERKKAQTQPSGEFILKGLSPKYDYTIAASKEGFTEASTTVRPPEEGLTKTIESPLEIYELPPSKGVFVKANDTFIKLNHIAVHAVDFYSKSAKQALSVYYVVEALLDKTKSQKIKKGDFIFMNIGTSSWYVTPLNELNVEADAEKYFEAPDKNYNYKGEFPKGLYCGLAQLNKETANPESDSNHIGNGPYVQIDLPKGKYILTTSKFNYWTKMEYSASKYSPKSGWLFEIE